MDLFVEKGKNLTKEKANMKRQKEEAKAFEEKMQELRETQKKILYVPVIQSPRRFRECQSRH